MGWFFIMPWFVGMVLFFFQSLVQVVRYAFTNLKFVVDSGMEYQPLSGFLDNFIFAFREDAEFPQRLSQSLASMLYQIPVIMIFSLFVAIVLNQKFIGRGIMRAVFFLPVIIAYSLGLKDWYHIIIYTLFTLGGIIRLGYFNIIAEESGKDKGVAKYHGLPVTSTSIILPLAYALKNFINSTAFTTFYTTIMAFTALLFILNFTFKKPQTKWLYVFVVFSIIMISYFIFGTK